MVNQLLNIRVLIVDDEPDSRALMHDILTLYGAEVYCAENGSDALQALEHVIPDVILLDLAMPGMDGWLTLKAIQARPSLAAGAPIVAISAHYSEALAQQALLKGFDLALPKPYKINELIDSLIVLLT